MNWLLIAALYFVLVPVIWGLVEDSGWNMEGARRGYVAAGVALAVAASIICVTASNSSAIGWAVLGIASTVFGGWGIPFFRNLYLGKYDRRILGLFREQ